MSPMTITVGAVTTDQLATLAVVGIVVNAVVGIIIAVLIYAVLRRLRSAGGTAPVQVQAPPAPVSAVPAVAEPIPNRQAMIAAISAVIAEELGTDISAIRILSVKKV